MMKPKYSIGEEVWFAVIVQVQKFVTCPDCFGKRNLRVILGDDSEVTIACTTCSKGYEPSTGTVGTWEYIPKVLLETVRGVEIRRDSEIEYSLSNRCCVKENDLFSFKQEAETRAVELTEQQEKLERERVGRKCKDSRTWAWHVKYHRGMIKEAERNVVRHTAMLNAAKEKVKGGEDA